MCDRAQDQRDAIEKQKQREKEVQIMLFHGQIMLFLEPNYVVS